MIQLSAPSISANAAMSNGATPPASPKGAETGDFAALLGAAGSTAEAPETGVLDLAAVMTATLAGLPDGKTGKAGGKTLPAGELAVAGSDLAANGDLETDKAPDVATSDQADVPIAAAIPVLPLIVPPLPGAGNPVEIRPVEFRAAGPVSTTAPTGVLPQSLPRAAAQAARIATAAPVAQQAAANGVAPAQVLQVKLSPIVTTDAPPQFEGRTGAVPSVSTAARATPMAGVAAQAAASPLTHAKTIGSAKADLGADGNINATAIDTGSERKAPAPATPASASAAVAGAEPGHAETAAQSAAQPAIQLSGQISGQLSGTPAARAADIAPVTTATPAAAEHAHDFTTLVDRLSEAREAASPQVVRTALQHAEFGRVSLQFRHDDAQLSVTMANADPAFASAVQSAAAASLAGNTAGTGDQSRNDGQHAQQQQQAAAQQQQSATSGNGQGQQNAAQARAEQGERNFQRAQSASGRAQQGDDASSDRAETGTRHSGIYA